MTEKTATGAESETVAPVAVISAPLAGQAALFDDPRRLLTLPLPELHRVAAEVVREGKPIFAHLRRVFGLVAWAVWNQSSELAYGEWELGYAASLSVPAPTLRRWRRDVVAAEDLPVPSVAAVRAAATKASLPTRKRAGQEPGSTRNGTHGITDTPSASPMQPGVAEAIVVARGARLPDPGPPPTVRASIAHLIDHLHALDPDEIGPAMTPTQVETLMDWTERVVAAAKLRKPRTSARQKADTRSDDCRHPSNRRLGNACGVCGATVK